MPDNDYGTFAGHVDVCDVDNVQQVVEYAMDRARDELLTGEQMFGLLRMCADCIDGMRLPR